MVEWGLIDALFFVIQENELLVEALRYTGLTLSAQIHYDEGIGSSNLLDIRYTK